MTAVQYQPARWLEEKCFVVLRLVHEDIGTSWYMLHHDRNSDKIRRFDNFGEAKSWADSLNAGSF